MDDEKMTMDMEMKAFMKEEIEGLASMIARGFDAAREDTDRRFDTVHQDIAEMKSDIVVMKSDIVEMKSDIAEIKSDIVVMKSDIVIMKSDISELQVGLRDVQMKVDRIDLRTQNHGDSLYEEMGIIRKETEVVKDDILAVKKFVGMKA